MSAASKFEFSFGPGGTPREEEEPMRLLLLGDFSGRPAGERTPLAQRPCLRVDVDNFDTVLARLAPAIDTPVGRVEFGSLDDFHPDGLLRKLELFRALREARSRPVPAGASGADTLQALLGGSARPAAAATPSADAGGIESLIRRVVAPYIVPDTRAATKAHVDIVDAALGDQMREVLHAPAFRSMEAAWRGVQWLVSRLELGETLQLHLLDVGAQELAADLALAGDALQQSAAFAAIVAGPRKRAGGGRWTALISLHALGSNAGDLRTLAALGAIASQAGGPLIAAAPASLWSGTPEDAEAWNSLRRSEGARWIGLVAPRLMLRTPYGARGEPLESFRFEELTDPASPDAPYLWAPGSLAAALLLGRAFTAAEGWSFSPGDEREIDDLPSCTRIAADGEAELVPVAETYLADTDSDRLMATGLMPLLSHRHRNTAMLARFQSIAQPSASLLGLPG